MKNCRCGAPAEGDGTRCVPCLRKRQIRAAHDAACAWRAMTVDARAEFVRARSDEIRTMLEGGAERKVSG